MSRLYFLLITAFMLVLQVVKGQVIYNAYAAVTNISGTTFTVSNVNEANHTFAATESVVVMQMQDDVIGTNTTNASTFGDLSAIKNAGVWEIATILSVTRPSGTLQTVTISSALTNTYNIGPNSSVQLITFRRLSAAAFTSSANITGLAWNGSVGGVIALYVGSVFTLGHSISADAIGFRGGAKNNPNFASTSCDPTFVNAIGNKWAGKGEGIYKNTNTALAGARGKMLNAGGGGTDENSGGGGGGNFTAGGVGGPGYNGSTGGCSPSVGGQGGIALNTQISGFRIFMGGGGGGGHENNSVGTAGSNGGGIILLKTGTLTTTGSCNALISASGASVANSGNDGSGGGGGGGSIVLNVQTFSIASSCSLTIRSNGGNGGTAATSPAHSGGGGGGQGVVLYSTAQPTTNMATTTTNGTGGCNDNSCTSRAGNASGTSNSGIFTLASSPLPIELVSFTVSKTARLNVLSWVSATEKNCSHYEVERTTDGVSYKTIGKVNSKSYRGNSSMRLAYNFTDISPEQGINYYRLKIVDLDDTYEYSFIVDADQGDALQLSDLLVFPNPSTGQFFLQARNGQVLNETLDLTLSDISGKEIEKKHVLLSSQAALVFDQLSLGYYILKIKAGTRDYFIKLVVN